ncbi:F420-dependent methylenetetrahydromethanopterin dehydrogenase [Candidatus Bathyarchaeota archaeon]|nr:MAG: F420-dependent methylenetetrahydromethanopterin dehydrogenase [Candidatus Bathyarchaeota archaeon]
MSSQTVRVGILKLGCVGTAPLMEYLLDERADRTDIKVRIVSSGAKMDPEEAEEVTKEMLNLKPNFVVVVSPNASLPGPAKAREILKEAGLPVIVVSDSPAKKVVKDLEAKGFGYIIVEADSMIGARREFLDPTEMACFNSDIIRVLAVTGVYNLLVRELDKVIQAFKEGKEPELPRFVVDKTKAVEAADLQNPYAKAKAMAAYEAARRVGDLNVEGCFKLQEREAYIPVVATAHELMSYASKLAAEAREIEKYGDTLTRKPHAKDGTLLTKVKLLEKPEKK